MKEIFIFCSECVRKPGGVAPHVLQKSAPSSGMRSYFSEFFQEFFGSINLAPTFTCQGVVKSHLVWDMPANQKVRVLFHKCRQDAQIPTRQTPGSAGYDIKAFPEAPVTLNPGERQAISTGIRVDIPAGYVLSVRPRSGLAINHGITMINSPGTIDSDFRGEIKILMVNLGSEPFTIQSGDRIAQVLLEKIYEIEWSEADELEQTTRGERGFGSTGRQ